MMMKKCNNCGYDNDNDAVHCQNCSTMLPKGDVIDAVGVLNIGDNNAISTKKIEVVTGSKHTINAESYTINQIVQDNRGKGEIILKIIPDACCDIYKDHKIMINNAPAGMKTEIPIYKCGEYIFTFINTENPSERVEYDYYAKEFDIEEFLYVVFKELKAETNAERRASRQIIVEKQHEELKKKQEQEVASQKLQQEQAETQRIQEFQELKRNQEIASIKRNQEIDELRRKQEIIKLKKDQEIEELKLKMEQTKRQAKAESMYVPLNPQVPTKKANSTYVIIGIIAVLVVGVFMFVGKDDNNTQQKAPPVQSVSQADKPVTVQKSVSTNTVKSSSQKSQVTAKPKTTKKSVTQQVKQKEVNRAESTQRAESESQPLTATKPEPSKPKSDSELYKEGRNLAINNKYSQAIPILEKSAKMGNREALYYLGMIYVNGSGGDKNTSKGFGFLLQAAQKGDKKAVFQVAEMYNSGTGTSKNKSQARVWYQKAQELGDGRAESRLRRL